MRTSWVRHLHNRKPVVVWVGGVGNGAKYKKTKDKCIGTSRECRSRKLERKQAATFTDTPITTPGDTSKLPTVHRRSGTPKVPFEGHLHHGFGLGG